MTTVGVRLIRPELDEQPPTAAARLSHARAGTLQMKKKKNKKKNTSPQRGAKTSGVLTSERRPHGEVVVVYPQELLGFSHGGFGHVGAALVNGPAGDRDRGGQKVGEVSLGERDVFRRPRVKG